VNKQFTPKFAEDIHQLETDLDQGWGIPTDWYSSPEHFDFEMEEIFSKSWLFVAPVHALQDPGDTVIGWAGKVPVVLTRDREGELRGFVNLCRHRGYAVATESKKCNVLTCAYHAWTYNLDGTFRGAPHIKNEPGFNKSQMSLLPVSVDTWGPGIFVNADPEALPLRAMHPQLDVYAEQASFPTDARYYLDNYSQVRVIDYDFESNWKLWYDNNSECYHCPTIHATSFGDAFDVDQDSVNYAEIDQFMTFAFNPTSEAVPEGKLKAQWQRAFQLFPGIGMTAQDEILLVYQALPTGPETTHKTMYCLTKNDADQELAGRWLDLWNQTFQEDQAATQIQQKGLRSGRLPRARYVTNQEGPVLFINRLILAAYKKAFG
jgi:phenylpropionate dioxygenase-like ring-hydroxylating dioxygenase large terminal subunit